MTLRTDTQFPTGSDGLTNARTRIVGSRTGPVADAVVAVVRAARAVGHALSRLTRRAREVVTPLGWVMLAFVPVGLLGGYLLGWLELVVIGWASTVLVIVAALYLVAPPRLAVALRLPHARTVVGSAVTGELALANPGRLRTLSVALEVPVGRGLVEVLVPSMVAHEEIVRDFVIPAERRGRLAIGPVRTVRADPLGLVRREHVWTSASELVVHPRTVAIPSMSSGFVRDLEGAPTRDLTTNDISFHALREYSPGDERRTIHWRSTAKTGRYMVRQFEETRRSHLVIALSLAAVDFATEAEFELAVSVAGSLGVRAIRDTRELSVLVGEHTPEFAKRRVFAVRPLSTVSRGRLLDDLAIVEYADSALPLADVARVAAGRTPGVSLAFLICGSGTSLADLRSASTAFPLGVEVIAIVCDPDAEPGLREVAGLTVITIGYLEELDRSIHRAAS